MSLIVGYIVGGWLNQLLGWRMMFVVISLPGFVLAIVVRHVMVERNLPVEVVSSRELGQDNLQQYKLVIVPYPLMLTDEEAGALLECADQSVIARVGVLMYGLNSR